MEAGFDPITQDANGCTALIVAVEYQNLQMVKLLLQAGPDPTHRESKGYDAAGVTAFQGEYRMGAYTQESTDMIAILERHAATNDCVDGYRRSC